MKYAKNTSKKLKKLLIEIEEEVHNKIKAHAALRNISMRIYVMRAIAEKMMKDEV